jgi:hypothetical protein
MGAQEWRIGTGFSWGVVLLSWIALFLVLALMLKSEGCNHSSEGRTPEDNGAWTASLNR